MSEIHPTIQRLESVLQQMQWRKSRFCDEFGISTQLYNSWRTRGIPAAKIKKVARFLGVSQDWLEEGIGQPHTIKEPAASYRVTSAEGERVLSLFNTLRIDQRTAILQLLESMSGQAVVPHPPALELDEELEAQGKKRA